MRVSLIVEACVSLRLTLELFYFIGNLVLLCYFDAWLNKIAQKSKKKKPKQKKTLQYLLTPKYPPHAQSLVFFYSYRLL